MWNKEYIGVIVVIGEGLLISVGVIGVSYYLLRGYKGDKEKSSIYECGYMPYREIRVPYTVSYILVGILFMLFDVEIGYLYPWAVIQGGLLGEGYWWGILFIVIVTIGLIYEWIKGGLDWAG